MSTCRKPSQRAAGCVLQEAHSLLVQLAGDALAARVAGDAEKAGKTAARRGQVMEHGPADHPAVLALRDQHEVLPLARVPLQHAPQPLAWDQRIRLVVHLALQLAERGQRRILRIVDLADAHAHAAVVPATPGMASLL